MRTWTTILGMEVTLSGISDEHLANLVQHVKHYPQSVAPLQEVLREAERRGLTQAFLDRAPFPYRDGKGNWIIWDYEESKIKVLGKYSR